MKKGIIIVALIGILFALVAGSMFAGLSFYKEYKGKIEYLEQQNMSGKSKIEGLEAKLDNFKSAVDDISSQIKNYSDSIKAIQDTVISSEGERKGLLSKLEGMKKDLQGWQKDYASTVIDIRKSVMSLRDSIDSIESKTKEVELGKITVKQDEKIAAPKEAPKKAQNENNFKSGNVRKVGSS